MLTDLVDIQFLIAMILRDIPANCEQNRVGNWNKRDLVFIQESDWFGPFGEPMVRQWVARNKMGSEQINPHFSPPEVRANTRRKV